MVNLKNVLMPEEVIVARTRVAEHIGDEIKGQILKEFEGKELTQEESDRRFDELGDVKLKRAIESN